MKSPQMIESGRPVPAGVLKTNRILWFSLVFGPVLFAITIIVLRQQGPAPMSQIPLNIFLPIGAIMLLTAIIVSWLIPRWILDPNADDQTFARQYGLANIIPLACLDGAAFFGLVVVFISGTWWPSAIIPATAFALQLLRFPRATV